MEELINPFVLTPPNVCLVCGGDLVLATSTADVALLTNRGRTLGLVSARLSRKLVCLNCGAKFGVGEDSDGCVYPTTYGVGGDLKKFQLPENSPFVKYERKTKP